MQLHKLRNRECEPVVTELPLKPSRETPDSETSTCRSFPDVPGTAVLTGHQEHQFREVVGSLEMLINKWEKCPEPSWNYITFSGNICVGLIKLPIISLIANMWWFSEAKNFSCIRAFVVTFTVTLLVTCNAIELKEIQCWKWTYFIFDLLIPFSYKWHNISPMIWICCLKDKVVLKYPHQRCNSFLCHMIMYKYTHRNEHMMNIMGCKTILHARYSEHSHWVEEEYWMLFCKEKTGAVNFIFLSREFH